MSMLEGRGCECENMINLVANIFIFWGKREVVLRRDEMSEINFIDMMPRRIIMPRKMMPRRIILPRRMMPRRIILSRRIILPSWMLPRRMHADEKQ